MDIFQQGKDKWIVQSEGVERWLKIQENTKGVRVLEDSGPNDSRKKKMEGEKGKPFMNPFPKVI